MQMGDRGGMVNGRKGPRAHHVYNRPGERRGNLNAFPPE
jgi:hypothetical protein